MKKILWVGVGMMILGTGFVARSARATEFCVNSVSALQTALSTAQSNGQN